MNPWEKIQLSDYENHMSLDSVRQLQTLNELMKMQLDEHPVSTVMILGIAGGNGLQHVNKAKYTRVYGIDINDEYLSEVEERYLDLENLLECRKIDIINDWSLLPEAELVIANLFIEYVGYEAFKKAILKSSAKYVSCVIQINKDENAWVSDSPYIHAFDELEAVHHQMREDELTKAMQDIGYIFMKKYVHELPNCKEFVLLNYKQIV